MSIGIFSTYRDSSLYVKKLEHRLIVIVAYVDNILLTRFHKTKVKKVSVDVCHKLKPRIGNGLSTFLRMKFEVV